MLTLLTSLTLSLAPQGVGNPPVVINEFSYDDSSTDDREFVELYNRSGKDVDLSGWTLESRDGGGSNSSFKVPASTTLKAGAFYVFGPQGVPNVNQVVGTTNIWENSDESLTLKDAAGKIIDTLIYEQNKNGSNWGPNLREGQGVWGNLINVDAHPTSWSRLRDGFDTNNNGRDFRMAPETPGAGNAIKSILPYAAVFDNVGVDQPVPLWGASFVLPHAIDPTKTSAFNPTALPAKSPQGGNAAAFWDPVGGGNHNLLLTDVVDDVVVEAYVYLDANLENSGETETWSIGVQGTSATFFNIPDPSRRFGFTANGNTGVVWTYQVSDKDARLYLVDHGDGGTDFKVLGRIDIKKGVNDGWQRLRLQVAGGRADGFFGGTFGCGDGTHIGGKLTHPGLGGVWVGYRERLGTKGDNPLIADLLTVRAANMGVGLIGQATKTTRGTPTIDVTGLPTLGFQGFGIALSGLVPSQSSVVAIGAAEQKPPIDLGALGAPAGARIYVTLDAVLTVGVDAKGEALLKVPIPCQSQFRGATLFFQNFDVDPALGVPLPIGHSQALRARIDG